MRYLIVGGTSIFGEGLIDRLLVRNDTDAIIATRLVDESEKEFTRDKLTWRVFDLRNVEETNAVVEKAAADVIFDFATQDSVGYSWENPTETVDINVIGTVNLLNAIRDYSPKARLVIGGSGEEYGRLDFSDFPANETANPRPNNIYGATKACQTMFAKLYHQAFKMDIIVVRTFYETSVKQGEKFAVSSFCKQFAEIEAGRRAPVIHVGNVNNIRDLTDVDDLVRAFEAAADRGVSGEVYNAAIGRPTTLLDIIRILEKHTGISVKIKMDVDRVRPMDSPAAVANVEKIEKDCSWKAMISLEETVDKILDYWRQVL